VKVKSSHLRVVVLTWRQLDVDTNKLEDRLRFYGYSIVKRDVASVLILNSQVVIRLACIP